MEKTRNVFVLAAISSVLAGAGFAQTSAFDNRNAAEDAVEDLSEDIEDEYERDIDDFGNVGRPIGFDGSVALRAALSDGNTDSADVGIGANMGYYDGTNGYEVNLAYSYGEDDGVETENNLLYGLDYTRDFGSRWFGYAQIQGSKDDYASFVSDTFAGIGVGYKVIDRSDITWNVSGGPGYRWAELSDATEIEEEALSLSSNYTARLTDTVNLTNDTDVIYSEADTVVFNDLGVNFSVTDAMALRTSLTTEYHSDPLPGDEDMDNTFGVSLVYSFN
ncbi:MAG: putative salt-induced outer membrane protein [Rhodobacteraceae bacterium HLUCCA08]|nr:MAG: putative salt-induced outer membrane protein [Rhodobacteraceae bacterium HLUCCA08]